MPLEAGKKILGEKGKIDGLKILKGTTSIRCLMPITN